MSHILTPPPSDLRYNIQISLQGGSGFQFITTMTAEEVKQEHDKACAENRKARFICANIANHSKGECQIDPFHIVGWLIAPVVLTPEQMRQVAQMQAGGPNLS